MKRYSSYKSKVKIRNKKRPVGQKLNFEVRLITYYTTSLAYERTRTNDVLELFRVIKNTVGGQYKIIHDKRPITTRTKILLENEADIYLVTLANAGLVYRIYRYV